MGKLQRRVLSTQHIDILGGRQFIGSIVGHHVVTHHAIAFQQIEGGLSHGALCFDLLVFLQHSTKILGREIDGITTQNMLRLDGGQHGIGPTKFCVTLILDWRHGQQQFVGKGMLFRRE